MSEYRYSQVENQMNNIAYGEIDPNKLAKLDKLLTKIDNDFKRKQKDITKPKLVEIMKTTHEIYQIVLYEISEMLESAKLSDLRMALNKIYNGQNLIMNYILKLNTNFEVQADKMLEQLQKNMNITRRKSVDAPEQDVKSTSKMASQMVQLQPIVKKMIRKTFGEKSTDTGEDMKEARNTDNLNKKQQELALLAEEMDEEGRQIAEFLKNRKAEVLAVGESKAQNNLKEVLKDLGKKKHQANDIEEEALAMEEVHAQQRAEFNKLQGSINEKIKGLPKKDQEKIQSDVKTGKAYYKNGELIYLVNQCIETDREVKPNESELKQKYETLRREGNEKEQKILQLEKKNKDLNIEKEAYLNQIAGLNQKISSLNLEKRKLEEKKEDKKKEQSLSKQDSEKIKKLVEENIKMKIRIKTLLEAVADLEKELGRNFERFRLFITNLNLTDEQKKAILAQAETLFKINISQKLNVKDMQELLIMDDLLKDPLFKQLCGSDLAAMTRQVKRDEQVRKQKMQRNPNYDPMFDPEFLNPGEKMITRKVKKIVKRQNSKGEWVEEELEVEEECIVNENGEILRTRDKPQVIVQSKETQQFLDAHGGFAIGGAKIMIPQRPQAKDGREIQLGEWFEDKSGKKMRKVQGKDGEDVYEVEEEYIDENGQKRTRVKQMKIRKDKNGNDIIEEEVIGADGKKQKIQKRVTKDKDGNDIIEEIITDENGNKIMKKQKVYKDKDGNEIIEEEITDQYGNKTTVKRKVMRDANGNEIIVEETIDAKGNKVITTKRKNEFGEDIVEQQIIDKNGKVKNIQKRAFVDENGEMVVEEVTYDAAGNKVITRKKVKKDANGNDVEEIEVINADGTITKKKIIKDKNGNDHVEVETINADGTVTKSKQKVTKNKDGSETIEEEVIDEFGNKIILKKRIFKDKNGNIVTEEERIDAKTGIKTITKTVKDQNGKESVSQQIVRADGSTVNVSKTTGKDADGNIVENEIQMDEHGKKVTVQRKIFRDKDGAQIKEETFVDENGNKKIVRTRVTKDKDGNEIVEETITNADGTKTVVRKRVYKDKDGNEIVEVETVDANGNKIVTKTKKNKNGEEIVEVTKTAADGKVERTVKKITKDKNGNLVVEEIKYNPDGTKSISIQKEGLEHKLTQTDGWNGDKLSLDQLLSQLEDLGIERSKLEQLRNQVMLKQNIKNKKQQQSQQQMQKVQIEDQFEEVRPQSADSNHSLDTLDGEDENEQDQADKLYKKMMSNKNGGMADLIRQVRNGLGKQGNETISAEEFREYLMKMRAVHQKCGENCPHLRRFYEKLGFMLKKYKRRFLKMKDTRIEAKSKLPQIPNNSVKF